MKGAPHGHALALLANISKGLPRTNTLAYLVSDEEKKSFSNIDARFHRTLTQKNFRRQKVLSFKTSSPTPSIW